jgi:hypothetical protein
MFARRLELDPRALGERFHAELREELVGGSQRLARVAPPPLRSRR